MTRYVPEKAPRKPDKVAMVGAGPAGLTAAYFLALKGYPVTIFEALPVAGGMMAVGIPEYRLPRKVMNAEIESILKLGVELKLNSPVTDVEALKTQGFRASISGHGSP